MNERPTNEKRLRERIYAEIDKYWEEVLFDGKKAISIYSISRPMYRRMWNHIYTQLEHLILEYQQKYSLIDEAINAMHRM
jgi:hypothetical protein